MRGFFGVALYKPTKEPNWSVAVRTAANFGAAFLCTIEARYQRGVGDTLAVGKHLPIFHFPDLPSALVSWPADCKLICVDVKGRPLIPFVHPERAIYILGGENQTLNPTLFQNAPIITIETRLCLNMAVALGIVLYDRQAKQWRPGIAQTPPAAALGGAGDAEAV